METLRPQPSLRGFVGFALKRFVEKREITIAEGAAYMIERWIDDNYDLLRERYGISFESFDERLRLIEQAKEKLDEL